MARTGIVEVLQAIPTRNQAMQRQDTLSPSAMPSSLRLGRGAIARILDFVGHGKAVGQSVTELSATLGVSRSSYYYWQSRRARIDAPEAERDFFESEAGVTVLQRLYSALLFVFVEECGCGVDRVRECLRLSGMDRHIAASHGSLYQAARAMEREILRYGQRERTRLGQQMERKRIAVCEDETFHPETCLVAMEPVSGYLLVEEYAESRDADTWDEALQRGLEGLPVEVVVLGSDQAKGLIAHAEQRLGASQAPDLTHAQRDLSRATARHLAQRLDAPREALAQAERTTQRLRQRKEDYRAGPRGPGRPPLFDRYIAQAEQREQEARATLKAAEDDRDAARASVRALADAYHLVDLETGQLQTADVIEQRMRAAFATLDEIAERSGIAERRRRGIEKARRLVGRFKAHFAFARGELDALLDGLELAPDIVASVQQHLIGGLYLLRAAARARSAEERDRLRFLADELYARAYAPGSPLAALDELTTTRLEATIHAGFDLFVRSTACVEGRNGQLALRHHSLHRLSKQRLAALTVIHNFHIRRDDRTTAAERFYGQAPEPLFEWLLANLPPPPRPRASRRKSVA